MDAVDEVKQRLNIEDVIGEYVELKRAGRNFKGLSPFAAEKTASFMVSPEKQIWHDFSSGKGGNMFSFVMEMEGLDFRQTLELLARKAGVDLEQYRGAQSGGNAKRKEGLHEALEAAAHFYQVQFSKNQMALEYIFKKRKFTKEIALEFRIGYAPSSGSALINYLKTKNFTEDEIQGAGLSARAYRGGIQDMFRGRIVLPLQDAQGQVIGFTARLLIDDKNAPKYINTPRTILYDKSRHVYGLHLAKESIRKTKFVVLVEGNMDVIASQQAGARSCVATAGTGLTEQHLKALSRFTGDIRLCFDADQAGLNATERAIPIAAKVGASLSIIKIPSGKDPDELIKQDPEAWQKVILKPQYALDWLMERYIDLLDISTALGKKRYSDVILNVVKGLKDPVEQEHYLGKLSDAIGVSKEALSDKLKGQATPRPSLKRNKLAAPQAPTLSQKQIIELEKIQDRFLSLTLLQPKLRDFLGLIRADMLINSGGRQLLDFLRLNPDFAGDATATSALRGVEDYVKILILQYEELYSGVELIELRYETARLQARLIEHYVKTIKTAIAGRLQTADDNETKTALAEAKELDSLLKQVKEA
ncbi:MAG: DNA primase [Candidatus Saccharimonadales bacterium]